jgi:hypothetical protein
MDSGVVGAQNSFGQKADANVVPIHSFHLLSIRWVFVGHFPLLNLQRQIAVKKNGRVVPDVAMDA